MTTIGALVSEVIVGVHKRGNDDGELLVCRVRVVGRSPDRESTVSSSFLRGVVTGVSGETAGGVDISSGFSSSVLELANLGLGEVTGVETRGCASLS